MSVASHQNFTDVAYDDLLCKKISIAIKRSNIFSHIKPWDLLQEQLGLNESDENGCEGASLNKVTRVENMLLLGTSIQSSQICNSNLLPTELNHPFTVISSANSISPKQKSLDEDINMDEIVIVKDLSNAHGTDHITPLGLLRGLLPSPESFADTPKLVEKECASLKIINLDKFSDSNKNKNSDLSHNSKIDKFREKPNKNLFNLAASLLPAPSQLYDKDSLINEFIRGDILECISLFKEVMNSDDKLSADDLCEVIYAAVEGTKLAIFPEICSCLEFTPCYSESLSNCFIKYKAEMELYQENVLGCLATMIDSEKNITITSFIKACYCVNNFDMMWKCVLAKVPTYKFEEKYFNASIAIFQNLNNHSAIISHDTMLMIIHYMSKYHIDSYEIYMVDIWLYCVLSSDINSETDLRVPEIIIDKVIEKLITMKSLSFLFVMKLLSKNWTLLYNTSFSVWLSHLMADKVDVNQCLLSLKESIATSAENYQELNNSFLVLSLNVMSVLNKRSLFTVSKKVYEFFFENNLEQLRNLLLTRIDKFEYKWIIVDCLISSADYQSALSILTDFDMLKDMEASFKEYDRVKTILPTLIINVLDTSNLSAVIDLFEQIVSIFLFNKIDDDTYTKICSKILDLIMITVFESKNKEIVKQMIVLVDHIVCSDIDFNISKESLRYLLVSSVQTDISFNELLDLIEQCFKSEVFETIQTAEDGLGSTIIADSSLSREEVVILITWLCRYIKLKLVELAQNEGASVRGNLMKVCSLKFILCPSKSSNYYAPNFGSNTSLNDLQAKFTESLNSPKYLSHPIKFTTINDSHDKVTIICENRILYNAVYYSDI